MPRLILFLLGPFQVILDGEAITGFATDKTRALLAYLAVEANRPHRRDALAGLLWPEQSQSKARHNLRQALSSLRHAISDRDDDPFLLVSRDTIQFNPHSNHWLDVTAFETLVEECKRHHHRRKETCLPCMRRMEKITELYRGNFLNQFFLGDSNNFEEWATLKRAWLQREAAKAFALLSDKYSRRGEYERARQYVRRQVALEPWREEAHRQLMRILALDGQRTAALAQYEICCHMLSGELGVKPTAETTQLYVQIRDNEKPPPDPPHLPHLPYPNTPFIGREKELTDLTELLSNVDCRLVTIFGPGGIGKTRLALQVAEEYVGVLKNGVVFVPLTATNSTEQLASDIANALQIQPREHLDLKKQVLQFLQPKELLLVLDNAEHALNGCALLSKIFQYAPDVVILVTSRERLNLREEWVFQIHGLTFPSRSTTEPEHYSAIDLFVSHAHRSHRYFSPDETQLSHIIHICQLVEGMPLGIELAASLVHTHSCRQISKAVKHNLDILTSRFSNVPERQRSIRATFEYSWQLLSSTEQDSLARLSIFHGGFSEVTADYIAETSSTILMALLDKSLIRHNLNDRYDIHPLLKQYTTEKLKSNLQSYDKTQTRFIHYFVTYLAQREPQLKSPMENQALVEIASEIQNIRLAWQIAVTRGDNSEIEHALESVYRFYDIRCRFEEGVALFEQVIERWDTDAEETYHSLLLGKIMARQGVFFRRMGYYQKAEDILYESLKIFQQLGLETEQAFCLINLADIHHHLGKYNEAEEFAQQSLQLSIKNDDKRRVTRSLYLLGLLRYRNGDALGATIFLNKSLVSARENGDPRLVMPPLNTLADIACHEGSYGTAVTMFNECLALSQDIGDKFNTAMYLNNLGTVSHSRERYKEANYFYAESLNICREIGDQEGEAIALSNLGEIFHQLKQYSKAVAYLKRGLTIGRRIQDQWTVMACLNNLGETAHAMGNYNASRIYLAEAVQIAADTQSLTMLTNILVNVASLFFDRGHVERTAMLLELVSHHPASEQVTKNKARRLMDEMNITPPDDIPESLDTIVAYVRAELAPNP